MYRYFEDKKTLKIIQTQCSEIIKELENELRINGLNSQIFLIGSGGRNMVMQNENQPIDFDYNLNVISYYDLKKCREIKELTRNSFNKIMRKHGLCDVEDSKSSLTTKELYLVKYPEIGFSIDLGIVKHDKKGNWQRLIHKKTGNTNKDEYFWNDAPNSSEYNKKTKQIKSIAGAWQLVRDEYKELKNMYLRRNDNKHPSFVCYIEAVNNVYNILKQKGCL
ncbi:MAG: hypothetical protein IKD36_02365 [Clostridia bacterium]|nr:hypothetical protein [Clostridia bacterium]